MRTTALKRSVDAGCPTFVTACDHRVRSAQTTRRAPTPVVDTTLPVAITSEMREAIFGPLARRLHACLETPEGTDPIPSVRIMMMIDDEGAIATVSVTPATLQACIEPIVTGHSFPRTRRGREVVVHTVRR